MCPLCFVAGPQQRFERLPEHASQRLTRLHVNAMRCIDQLVMRCLHPRLRKQPSRRATTRELWCCLAPNPNQARIVEHDLQDIWHQCLTLLPDQQFQPHLMGRAIKNSPLRQTEILHKLSQLLQRTARARSALTRVGAGLQMNRVGMSLRCLSIFSRLERQGFGERLGKGPLFGQAVLELGCKALTT